MAFTSYVTLDDANDYLTVFKPDLVGTLSDEQLTRNSYILDRLYRDRFIGSKTDAAQDKEWPRNGDTVVPDAIQHAVVELTLLEVDGVDVYSVEPGVQSRSTSVGAISESVTYKDGTVFSSTNLTVLDTILGAYIVANTATGGIAFARVVKGF